MNFQELKDAAIAYADRYTDVEIDTNFSVFVILVEARVNRLLKVRDQTARAYVNCVDEQEFYALPSDWRGMRDIQVDTPNAIGSDYSTTPISLIDPKGFEAKKKKQEGHYYCVIGNQIQVTPTFASGSSIQMVYYQKVPNLNAQAPNNWMSDEHPDIYLAGLTGEISLFAKDYDASTGWFNRLTTSVDELENVDWQERWSGDVLTVRTDSNV
jgi:hypothetical protein